jgi:hypothetical protein
MTPKHKVSAASTKKGQGKLTIEEWSSWEILTRYIKPALVTGSVGADFVDDGIEKRRKEQKMHVRIQRTQPKLLLTTHNSFPSPSSTNNTTISLGTIIPNRYIVWIHAGQRIR